MKTVDRIATKVRRGEPIPPPLAAALSVASAGMRAGMWLRKRAPRFQVDARVISYGNITTGGAGKTPAVIERAQQEIAAGHRVAVITRGYGGAHKPGRLRGADAPITHETAARFGDEPALIASKVPEAYVFKSADRVKAAVEAVRDYGCGVIILDDGFQYLPLARDEDILLLDSTNPFGNGRLVPRGILREPLTAMARATAFILTRCDLVPESHHLAEALRELCPGAPIRQTRHQPTHLWNARTGERLDVEALNGQASHVVCAIGNPEAFCVSLERLGATLLTAQTFRDHATIPPEALPQEGFIVTTEKDAIRMAAPPKNLWALAVTLQDM